MVFLEGTGSLLLDRANEKAYCFVSRADEELFIEFCEDFDMHQYCLSFPHGKRRTKIDLSHERYDVFG
jgi:hypothetical protein